MPTPNKQLDREFLTSFYNEKVNDLEEIFESFLNKTPTDVVGIFDLLNRNNHIAAEEKLHKVIPEFICIGLPQLSVKLQIVEVYLNFYNLSKAKLLMRLFINELNEYMPAIRAEYCRLKAIHNNSQKVRQ